MTRTIGIRHRIKKTAAGEARPTQLWLSDTNIFLELEDDNAELDWVRGTFPVSYRDVEPDDDLSAFSPRHIKWRKVRAGEDTSGVNHKHLRMQEGKPQVATKVPEAYDGLKPGDVYAMSPGSGDRLAFALSRAGEKLGTTVLRLPPSILKLQRGNADKDEDAKLLGTLATIVPDLFHEVTANTRAIILVRERQAVRMDAMKARIACEQRLRQTLNGAVFCREGDFAELDIEAQFEDLKANDRILSALVAEEDQRIRELDRAIQGTQVWQHIFDGVKGIGPALAGRLISAIGGIERFLVEPDQQLMDTLYEESLQLEREADFKGLKRFVEPGQTEFDTLRRVASWCARNGRPNQAALLERAVECHQERSKLRHKAKSATRSKLKQFCGVAVTGDGKFPRRRSGSVANWHPDARQALFLLADQFNRQSDRTRWGKLLLEYKVKLRAAHPKVITDEHDKKCYTDGHIHKMALWRTVTKFVEWLADEWSELARSQKLQAARKRVA